MGHSVKDRLCHQHGIPANGIHFRLEVTGLDESHRDFFLNEATPETVRDGLTV